MSHSANNITNHRLLPSKELTERVPEWEVYFGMVGYLYIVGPGPSAMLKISTNPTLFDIQLAQKAVIILNQTRREDSEAGPDEIKEILNRLTLEDS